VSVYSPDLLHESGPSAEQKKKRLIELKIWIARFISAITQTRPDVLGKISIDDDLINQINESYWEIMYERVKPRLIQHDREKRADRHKIASLTELLINWYAPVRIDPEEQTRMINSRLAYYIAMNIIGNWKNIDSDLLHISDSFAREHLALLMALPESSESLPIFTNSATWYLAECIYLARKNAREQKKQK